ncbi:MAG: histidine phosphatase family protein [Clostridia bacterium]
METVVYLIRHSVRFNNKEMIESYKTNQSDLMKYEKIILSVVGEKRAEILSKEQELQNIDIVYTSNCVRTLQTAKYLLDRQNLKVNIDERFDERRPGKPNEKDVLNWYTKQYEEENYKAEDGESRKEVTKRMTEAFEEVINKNKGKRIAIFSHGYSITFLLLKWCKLESVQENRVLKYSFKGNVIFNKRLNSPDVFKLTINDKNEVVNVENIEFDDLEFDDFNKGETCKK